MSETNSQNQNSNQKNCDNKNQTQNVNQIKPAPVEYENVEIHFANLKGTYKYYMTNDWNLLLKKLDSLGFKAPLPTNWRWNPNLGQEIRAKMAELGVIYSLTLDNGCRVLNNYRNGSNLPYIVFLDELKKMPDLSKQLSDVINSFNPIFDLFKKTKETSKWPPLMVAVFAGSTEIVKYLISQNEDVNYQDSKGFTPLFWAIQRKNKEMIDILIKSGADPSLVLNSKARMLGFYLSIVNNETDVLKILKDAGVDLDKICIASKNPDGRLSFNDTLDFFIEEFKLGKNKVSQIYKNTQVNGSGGMSKQTFSKIRNNKDSEFHPGKKNVFLLAIGMGLNLESTETLLSSAGYVFDDKSEIDMIIKEFIKKRNYNMEDIERELFEKTGKCLGNWGDEN